MQMLLLRVLIARSGGVRASWVKFVFKTRSSEQLRSWRTEEDIKQSDAESCSVHTPYNCTKLLSPFYNSLQEPNTSRCFEISQ